MLTNKQLKTLSEEPRSVRVCIQTAGVQTPRPASYKQAQPLTEARALRFGQWDLAASLGNLLQWQTVFILRALLLTRNPHHFCVHTGNRHLEANENGVGMELAKRRCTYVPSMGMQMLPAKYSQLDNPAFLEFSGKEECQKSHRENSRNVTLLDTR